MKNSKHRVVVITENRMKTYPIVQIAEDVIETKDDILPLENAVQFYDETNNCFTYFYNLDIPSKVEASKLKLLRRSQAIKNIFKYERDSQFDMMKIIPWIICALAVIF